MSRPVRTIFYADKNAQQMTKKIASGNPIRATGKAVEHMRRNTYKALLAEVYDEEDGKLYAVIVRELGGRFDPHPVPSQADAGRTGNE